MASNNKEHKAISTTGQTQVNSCIKINGAFLEAKKGIMFSLREVSPKKPKQTIYLEYTIFGFVTSQPQFEK